MVLDEGKNRHIRRMMESMGIEVLRLVRVGIGPLRLGDLPKGKHRSLTAAEKRMLDSSMRGET
jgi:23S rRNA pseudouridine2605 synthase